MSHRGLLEARDSGTCDNVAAACLIWPRFTDWVEGSGLLQGSVTPVASRQILRVGVSSNRNYPGQVLL